jgi:hypothetical protein
MQVLTNVSTQNWTLHRLEVMLMWPRTSWQGSIWPQSDMPLEKKKLVFHIRMKSAVTRLTFHLIILLNLPKIVQ